MKNISDILFWGVGVRYFVKSKLSNVTFRIVSPNFFVLQNILARCSSILLKSAVLKRNRKKTTALKFPSKSKELPDFFQSPHLMCIRNYYMYM